MAATAKAVNARAAVASSAYIALGYCEVKVAIARGPQNRIRSDLRRPDHEIQKFSGGACPQTPLACALRARAFVYHVQYCLQIPPPDQCK